MPSKMLIDASHPEETRVVVLKGNRVEEFDFESASKRQLRGNIYLAKVTRVEPSLQAAFIDYGGNRHGFLAFSEIHPDYYQIPHADRQALLEEEARAHRDEDDEGRGNGQRRTRRHKRDSSVSAMERRGAPDESVSELAPGRQAGEETHGYDDGAEAEHGSASEQPQEVSTEQEPAAPESVAERDPSAEARDAAAGTEFEPAEEGLGDGVPAAAAEDAASGSPEEGASATWSLEDESPEGGPSAAGMAATPEAAAAMIEGGSDGPFDPTMDHHPQNGMDADENGHEEAEEEVVEHVGGDEIEETVRRAPRGRRHYKIQEVIKRRQILLVQVVKEERGNKGAALTTYLSLAGRYSVLMPNTARGGGISRKITDAEDRKRLKAIAQDLEVPEGMGIILRTAGAARSKVEVNRDFEYLLRMWESVRELTLKSTAPSLVYEEGSLIKRSIRDLYTRDVEDVVVAGEEGYREARDFMRMLMPSAAKNVQLYADSQPIFAKTGAEAQLDAMFSNHVTLKSGGYLVINQTEALVAIDVNSGRSTREHNIEDTALRTNLEAADEIARQLRLRDLAGLIVVDFIDMEEGRNNRAVERRIKDALKNDRARIQIGRISHFGLLEMSRQRIRTGVLEGSTVICPHCAGSGTMRSTASIALHVLRLLEDSLLKDATHNLIVRTRTEVALYVLNQKRSTLTGLEARFGVSLSIMVDETLTGMIYHAIERGELATPVQPALPRHDLVRVDSVGPLYDDLGDEEADESEDREEAGTAEVVSDEQDRIAGEVNGDGRRRKRRRRRRGRDRESYEEAPADAAQPSDEGLDTMARTEDELPIAEHPPEFDPERDTLVETVSIGGGSPADLGTAAGDDLGVAVDEGEAVEAPRRRRSRRGSSRPPEAVPSEAAPAVAGLEPGSLSGDDVGRSDDAGPAPKRRRPARSRSAASASADAAIATWDVQAGSETDTPAQAPDEEPVLAGGVQDSGTPLLSRADLDSDASQAKVDDSAPAKSEADSPSLVSEPEPDRPKRSGWWQRAKATFGS